MSAPDLVIDARLARRLVDAQFPEWSGLPLRPVEHDGWDNRTFRLGDELSVRLPSAAGYREQVAKEQEWLPRLAPHLPLPIPAPVARGVPGEGYPWPWSVYRWLPGRPLALEADADPVALAEDVAGFLRALQSVPAVDGPAPGTHNFFRGAPPVVYEEEALAAFEVLDRVPGVALSPGRARAIWADATATTWTAPPVWFHGDVAVGNLLMTDGRLSAVIDFGTSGVGDPACDLVLFWTFLDPPAAGVFRDAAGLDDATWARAAGWALWKAAITVRDRPDHAEALHTLARLAEWAPVSPL